MGNAEAFDLVSQGRERQIHAAASQDSLVSGRAICDSHSSSCGTHGDALTAKFQIEAPRGGQGATDRDGSRSTRNSDRRSNESRDGIARAAIHIFILRRALSERGPFGPQRRLGAAATAAVGGAGHAGGGIDRRTLEHVAGNAGELGVGVGLQQKGLVAGLLVFTHHKELGVLAFELLDVQILLTIQNAGSVAIVVIDDLAESGFELAFQHRSILAQGTLDGGQSAGVVQRSHFILSHPGASISAATPASEASVTAEAPNQDQEDEEEQPHAATVRLGFVKHDIPLKVWFIRKRDALGMMLSQFGQPVSQGGGSIGNGRSG